MVESNLMQGAECAYPIVSIVTVVFNEKALLKDTISSVSSQDYPNIEYIVVDGASTDGTVDLIKENSNQIKVWTSEADDGIYHAMNKGIAYASGEWIIFMNAGDTFSCSGLITKLAKYLINPDLDIVAGDRYLLDKNEKKLQKANGVVNFWEDGSPGFHQSLFVRSKLLKENGFNLNYKLSSDFEFMVRSVVEGRKFEFVPIPFSNFLEGGRSKKQTLRSQVEAVKILLDYAPSEDVVRRSVFFRGLVAQNQDVLIKPKKEEAPSVARPDYENIPIVLNNRNTSISLNEKGCRILIVDPIFRGSRLFYSWLVADAFQKKASKIDLLTRSFAETAHYNELFSNTDHTLYDGIEASKDFWFGILTKEHAEQLIKKIEFLDSLNDYDFIYFSGLNENYPNLVVSMLGKKHGRMLGKNIIFIEYDVRHLITTNYFSGIAKEEKMAKAFKDRLSSLFYFRKRKKLTCKLLDAYENLKIGVLDERVLDGRYSNLSKNYKSRIFYLPDPCPENLKEFEALSENKKVQILLVGLQSRRKGLDQLIKLVKRYPDLADSISFVLVGNLTEETEIYRSFLIEMDNLEWVEEYLSEDEIRKQYERVDYVLLPYTPDFTSSSGVLSYATAFRKPVISTSHGLVGYKVKKYKIGLTYKYNDIDSFYRTLMGLIAGNCYLDLVENCLAYACAHGIQSHQERIISEFENEQ